MRITLLSLLACLAASPAFSAPWQREAVSPSLSPDAAASAFHDAVTSICIPAVAGGTGVSALPAASRARLQASSDANTRQQAGAAADENVWDVVSAKGAVLIREKAGRCVVSVYGAPVVPTILSMGQRLSEWAGFEKLVQAPAPTGLSQSLIGRGTMVQLNGSEPGRPGHRSRLSVVTATVFGSQAR
jgi:hypothetical protein